MYLWGDTRPYHSYAAYCARTFGRPMQKLPVDGGFTCPNRDGTVGYGGCSFCSNAAFTPAYCNPRHTVSRQLDDALAFRRRGLAAGTGLLVYFQSYSSTHAPLERLRNLFEEALRYPGVAGIVVGTRPDCVDAAKLDYLAETARRAYVCIEYGIESTSDATLRTIDRGHDFAAAQRAVAATAERGIPVGAHFILGLPDEDDSELLDRTRIINALPLTTVKFHQLQFVEGTRMTALRERQPERFRRWTAAEYIDLMSELLRRLRPDLVVERIAAQTPPRIRCRRPWGLLRGDALWRMLEKRLMEKGAHQGDLAGVRTASRAAGSGRMQ